MRRSEVHHVLALLRRELNLSQEELATLAGKSTNTIKSVELGRLKLSESLAEKIGVVTNVNPACLLKNDLAAPLTDWNGRPYTAQAFHEAKERGDSFQAGGEKISRWSLGEHLLDLFAVYVAAEKRGVGTAYLFRNRFKRMVDEFIADFGQDLPTVGDFNLLATLKAAIGGELPQPDVPAEPVEIKSRRRGRTAGGKKVKVG